MPESNTLIWSPVSESDRVYTCVRPACNRWANCRYIIEMVSWDLKKCIKKERKGLCSGGNEPQEKDRARVFQHSVTGARDRRKYCAGVKEISLGKRIKEKDRSSKRQGWSHRVHWGRRSLTSSKIHRAKSTGYGEQHPNLSRCLFEHDRKHGGNGRFTESGILNLMIATVGFCKVLWAEKVEFLM